MKQSQYINITITNSFLIILINFFNIGNIKLAEEIKEELKILSWSGIYKGDYKNLAKKLYNIDFDYDMIGCIGIYPKILKNILHITMIVKRPGILIGKSGTTFDGITKYLSEHFNKEVRIKIIEAK